MIVLSILRELYENIMASSWLEAVAVSTGLLSVWFAKKENTWFTRSGSSAC